MELFEAWGGIDRPHRKLAHRGSRIDLVRVSESAMRRALAAEGLILPDPPETRRRGLGGRVGHDR